MDEKAARSMFGRLINLILDLRAQCDAHRAILISGKKIDDEIYAASLQLARARYAEAVAKVRAWAEREGPLSSEETLLDLLRSFEGPIQ
jgi:hypothetical protein